MKVYVVIRDFFVTVPKGSGSDKWPGPLVNREWGIHSKGIGVKRGNPNRYISKIAAMASGGPPQTTVKTPAPYLFREAAERRVGASSLPALAPVRRAREVVLSP